MLTKSPALSFFCYLMMLNSVLLIFVSLALLVGRPENFPLFAIVLMLIAGLSLAYAVRSFIGGYNGGFIGLRLTVACFGILAIVLGGIPSLPKELGQLALLSVIFLGVVLLYVAIEIWIREEMQNAA